MAAVLAERALIKVAATCVALASAMSAPRAFALDPTLDLLQMHHTCWTIEDGAPPDVWALAQSPDGYLWLGTGSGLFKFDGVRFEKLQLPAGEHLPSFNVNAIYADGTGDVWIGFVSGDISRLHAGHLKTFRPVLPGAPVYQIAEDRRGIMWAALKGLGHGGGLVRYSDGKWEVVGEGSGFTGGSTSSLVAARDGNLWVATETTLFVLRPGAKMFEVVGGPLRDGDRVLQAPDGGIWLSSGSSDGLRAVAPQSGNTGADSPERPAAPTPHAPASNHAIIDRDGTLWGTYPVGGVFRIARFATGNRGMVPTDRPIENFALSDGLSSDIARPVFEDREGNIWVGTNLGLDRFRPTNVVAAQGIPATSPNGYFIARGEGNSVFVASSDTLFRAHPDRPAEVIARFSSIPTFLAVDRSSAIWLGTRDGIQRLENGKLHPVPLPREANGIVGGWVQDDTGTICLSVLRTGVFCDIQGSWVRSPLRPDESQTAPTQIAHDNLGGTWLNYDDELARIDERGFRAYSAADGLSIGGIDIVAAGVDDVLLGGEFGLARYDGRKFSSLRYESIPAFSRITGIVEASNGNTWLNGIMGVVRVKDSDLLAAFAGSKSPLQYKVFDLRDGLPGVAQEDSHSQTALEAADGRLWFVTSHGVAWIDPRHLTQNAVPPPVSIRSVVANGAVYPQPGDLSLPERTENVEIDYTALSLSIPERVRFRYRLDGVDRDWVDPGTRRVAFYTKLEPGRYRFHVVAANNDGVWNLTGATLTFVVPPTFMQSIWFKALLLAALCSLLWLLYAARLRQLSARMRGRLEERLAERERIARELHDTLLQGFQGLVMRFQAAAERIGTAHPARREIDDALDTADEILEEGRNRVFNLRAGAEPDIAEAFAAAARRLLDGAAIDFSVTVEGRVRLLHPIVQEEITRIGQEALANAVVHGQPDTIAVLVVYQAHEIRMSIRDDGVGLDPKTLADDGQHRHFGIIGMRERARKIHGQFALKSRPGAGTEINLSVPASVAYVQASPWLRMFARGRRLSAV
jgi:signal transduction histidine kinase/ligand-binding sensor domain-containing protein